MVIGCSLVLAAGEPENDRLPNDTFRRGLKQYGLNDLLDYYVQQFPPGDPIEAALLARELKLNIYADPSVPAAERMTAAREAHALLQQLLQANPDHPQRYTWQLDLARDLIDRQAEPFYNNILYRGGSSADREQLRQLTTAALAIYDRLIAELTRAVAGIDDLSIQEFERLAKIGYIEQVENLLPKTRYFHCWARYYHALTLSADDPERANILQQVLLYLQDESKLTTIEHETSHYQAQSLLLAGMTSRLLNNVDQTEQYLSQAANIVSNLPDFAERYNLRWVQVLAGLERIKNFRDNGRYDQALQLVTRQREELPKDTASGFAVRFALALLEGTVYSAQAAALPDSDTQQRQQLLLQSRAPLIALARAFPKYQDQIYDTLYDLLGNITDPSRLDSFEKNIYISGLLRQAHDLQNQINTAGEASAVKDKLNTSKRDLITRARRTAELLLNEDTPLAREIRPEVRFNLAVCHYELDETIAAITDFARVANEHPDFERSEMAAQYAVRLAESIYLPSQDPLRNQLRPHYLLALQTLLERFPTTDIAQQHRFAFARALQEAGNFTEAAQQYSRVNPDDPQYVESLYRIPECDLEVLRQKVTQGVGAEIINQARLTLDGAQRFRDKLTTIKLPAGSTLKEESLLISAEAYLLKTPAEPAQTITMLDQMNTDSQEHLALLGRSLRLQILALQALGQSEEAARIIPEYVQRDPQSAGATLSSLLETLKKEHQQSLAKADTELSRTKAADALLVARQLAEWANQPTVSLEESARVAFRLELAEALLRTTSSTDAQEALNLLQSIVSVEEKNQPDGRCRNGRALMGLADAHFALQQYEPALKLYSRIFQESVENTDLWWRAFLRDIECRLHLKSPPDTLYSLLKQKEYLYPELGGAAIAGEFHRLEQLLQPTPTSKP
ncbi:MAG: hypothetical protein HJJLKODD_02278 [Phycisphaerae bacterium]|nr:hypothetical protein [Phycisphaerae bacterium]